MNRDPREFSKQPVLFHKGPDESRHQFFVMYHATKTENVSSILANGFRESTKGMFGPGLYVSRDIEKTRNADVYGSVCFKLLVYIGKTTEVTKADNKGSWRSHYDSAYLPPNNDAVKSGREETCLRSAKQARILGIAYGFDEIEPGSGEVRNLEGTNEVLDAEEWQVAYGKWQVDGHLCKSIEISRGRNAWKGQVCSIDSVPQEVILSFLGRLWFRLVKMLHPFCLAIRIIK